MRVMLLCPECSAEIGPGVASCGSCGAALPPHVVSLPAGAADSQVPPLPPNGAIGAGHQADASSAQRNAEPASQHRLTEPAQALPGKHGRPGRTPSPEVGYNTADWSDQEVIDVTSALEDRGVRWHSDGADTLLVAARHERLADTIIQHVTGVDLELPDALSDEEFAETALDYTTDDWSPEQFAKITQSLDSADIRWLALDGYLLVAEESESAVDQVIYAVTGDRPV